METKKLFFSIKLFKIIKLLSGYIELVDDGIIIHLSSKKAIIMPYKSLIGMKKRVKPLKDYHIIKWELEADFGVENNTLFTLEAAFAVNYVTSIFNWIMSNIKPYLVVKNKVNVLEEQNVFRAFFYGTVLLNLLMIILSLIKIVLEKIFYALSTRKQPNNANY